jgi:hypothetical protein
MPWIRSYCLEQLGIFVGASNFLCIRFVDRQRDNMPSDRNFIKERFHGIFFVFISVLHLVMMLWRSAAHCLHSPYPKLDVGFENRQHTEDRLLQKFSLLSLCKLDIPISCTKEQSLKKRKIGYLLYRASTEQKSAGFWPTIFANGFPRNPGGACRPLHTAQVLLVVNTRL